MTSPDSYRYALSLPERALRSLAALSGGLLREIGEAALPAGVRRTALYSTMVDVTLRFLIEEVGQVDGVYEPRAATGLAENFLLKRAAGHGIELLGILAFHASPVWILAALADATGAGHALVHEIAEALKEEGLLDRDARFDTVDQILGGLEKTGAHLARTLNLPPVDVAGLRREWETLKRELPQIPPPKAPSLDSLERIWAELKRSAAAQNRSVYAVSSVLAVSTIAHVPANVLRLSRAGRSAARRTGRVLGGAILDHYSGALNEISKAGFADYWRREFRPYLRAAAEQFGPRRESSTERILRRAFSQRKAPPGA